MAARVNFNDLAENEALKEFGRMLVLAVIPVLIDYFSRQTVDLRTISFAVLLAVLRALDRYFHKLESENPVTKFLEFK